MSETPSIYSKVWVVQEGRNDYSSAEEYGDVQFITRSDLSKVEDSQQNIDLFFDIRRFLRDYVPGTDYVLPAGNPMVVALVTLSLEKGKHNLLKWDGRRAIYIPYELTNIH